jgi:hypothetical protein
MKDIFEKSYDIMTRAFLAVFAILVSQNTYFFYFNYYFLIQIPSDYLFDPLFFF